MTHGTLQKACLDYLEWLENAYAFKSGSGSVKTASGRHFKTGKPGCPDITVCYESRYIGIEVKVGKDKQRASQKKAEEEIKKSGGEYYIVRSLKELKEIF